MFQNENLNSNRQLDRRSLICGAAKSLLGVAAWSALGRVGAANSFAPPSTFNSSIASGTGSAKSVIYIYLWGGLSQIDSFDPKPGTDSQGPVKVINSNSDELRVTEYFPQLAKQMDKVCVVRSMSTNQGEHQQGSYLMRTGYQMNQTISHPGLGAWGSYFLESGNQSLPGNIRIGDSHGNRFWGGFLDPEHAALPITDPNEGLRNSRRAATLGSERFNRRLERVRKMNQQFLKQNSTGSTKSHVTLFDEAVRLMKSEDLESFDLTRESPQHRTRYGHTTIGQGCLLAKRLVQRGVRFIEVNDRGWDTHVRNFSKLQTKGPELDQALAALLQDLESAGLLKDTLVVVGTEFGRSPKIDQVHVGRDHHPQAFSCLLAGGGVEGGQAYGATDEHGHEVSEKMVSVQDFNATIGYAMGLPLEKKVISPTKRPFTVANGGKPIKSIFG